MQNKFRIRDVREDRDLSQTTVAALLKKSQRAYSRIESGEAELRVDDLATLCKFYNLSADYLTGLTDEPRPLK